MNKIFYIIPFLLLMNSLNCEGQTSGLLIKRKNFIKKVSNINNKLATKDTSNILTFDCVEIIRILNTLRINGDKIWIKSKGDSIILNYFINEMESSSRFNKLLEKHMDRKLGDIEPISGFGVRYIQYDIYFGGREINDNSYYTMKKSIFRLK